MLLLWAGLAQAATLTVDVAGGADFSSINEAMLASSDGDLIQVADGVYAEALVFPSHDLRVVASGSALLDSTGIAAPTVTIIGNSAATELSGFELVPEPGQSAVVLDQASPLLKGLLVQDYTSEPDPGGPAERSLVYSEGGAPTLEQSRFANIELQRHILEGQESAWTIRGSTFSDCYSLNAELLYIAGSLVLEDSEFIALDSWAPSLSSGRVNQLCGWEGECTARLSNNLWQGTDALMLTLDADSVEVHGDRFEGARESSVMLQASGSVNLSELSFSKTDLIVYADQIDVSDLEAQDGHTLRLEAAGDLELKGLLLTGALYFPLKVPLYLAGTEILFSESTLSDNAAAGDLIQLWGDEFLLEDLSLTNNRADGSLIQVSTSPRFDAARLLVSGNTTGQAAILSFAASSEVSDSTFVNNAPNGALYLAAVELLLQGNTFCGNVAQIGGGASINSLTSSQVLNNSFSDNTASSAGGGILVNNPHPNDRFENNTFVANTSPLGAGMYINITEEPPSIVNNVFAYQKGPAVYGSTVSYTGWWENGSDGIKSLISTDEQRADPLFADYSPDGVCNDSLWIRPDSPFKDVGDPSIKDLDGSVSDLGISGGPGADPDTFDGDGDGVPFSEDCDDTEGAVGDQEELPYDGLDNDCDPSTPDDDLDGDGFGVDEDCDDTDATVYPGTQDCPEDENPVDKSPEETDTEADPQNCSCTQHPSSPIFWPVLILAVAAMRRRQDQ